MRDEHWTFLSLPELTRTGAQREEDIEPSTFASDSETAIRLGHKPYGDDGDYTVPALDLPGLPGLPMHQDYDRTDEVLALAMADDEPTKVPGSGSDALEIAAAADLFSIGGSPSREPLHGQRDEEGTSPFDTGILPDNDRFASSETLPGDLLHLAFKRTSEIEKVETDIVAGRYRIEEPIGEGGMGSVFRATHLRLGKAFALKRMHGGLSGDPYLRDLFYREARLASSLSHPNIVSVVDYGEDRNLGAFMVMELVSGKPPNAGGLGQSIALRKALDILIQIAEALHYSHSKGVIHSDVKPDNIIVAESTGAAQRGLVAKLVDFGLAHLQTATQRERGVVHGTPQYLAPERFMGAPPHPSMDIYGLGVVAYELISGNVPFAHSRTPHAQLHASPAPLMTSAGELVDERVNLLVQRMLKKNPEDRHKDMGAVIFEMRTAMEMLGFSKGRARRPGRQTNQPADGPSGRTRQALRAFELFPLPGALLTGEGVILSANRAMVDFLGRERRVEGERMADPMLLGIYPQFRADLRYVNIIDQGYTRRLLVARPGAPDLEIFVHMSPGEKHSREVLMLVMTTPEASE